MEVTGNVYCRTPEDVVERPLPRVKVYLKRRQDIVSLTGSGNGRFRLLVPASDIIDHEIVVVYSDAGSTLGEDPRRVTREDVVTTAGRMALQLPPRIFTVSNCTDLDLAGLRETVRLATERMSHRAAVIHTELMRAHASRNPDTSACLNEALSRVGAHLRFAESRVPNFMDALGNDPVRARREVTAIKIADERVAELVEEADHCVERSVAHVSAQSTKYDPDPLISPSDLTEIPEADSNSDFAPWGRKRPAEANVPADDRWHFYPGAAAETGYDSNFLQKDQGQSGGAAPAGWQFRPSFHLSLRRYEPKPEGDASVAMHPGPVQSANLTLLGMLLTSVEAGGRPLGLYRDVAVAADFTNRFGDDGPLGGAIGVAYHRIVEPGIEPENRFSFGENRLKLSAEALIRPGAGRFEMGASYRLSLTYNDSAYLRFYDRFKHAAVLRERWLFLPETALVHETELTSLTYVGNQRALNDSIQIRSRMGLVGVLTERVSIEALVGFAEGYYGNEHGKTIDFSGPVGHARVEWFLGPIAQNAYPRLAPIRPSFALTYDHDFRDNLTSDYYRLDRGVAELSLGVDNRWMIALHSGIGRVEYSRSRYYNPLDNTLGEHGRFSETRIDLAGTLEYRVLPRLRFTASLRYDRNLSSARMPIDPNTPGVEEPLAFHRWRAYGGAIWSM